MSEFDNLMDYGFALESAIFRIRDLIEEFDSSYGASHDEMHGLIDEISEIVGVFVVVRAGLVVRDSTNRLLLTVDGALAVNAAYREAS